MLTGTVVNSNRQENPYAKKTENRQTLDVINKADTASKVESQKMPEASSEPHDEYIPGGYMPGETPGIYRPEKDENGLQKIVFDRPDLTGKSKQSGTAEKSGDKKHGMWCTVSTNKVDAEIKRLKEQKQQIEQQLKNTREDENRRKDLEKRLSQVESELTAKDNDVYRKQHATYTYS